MCIECMGESKKENVILVSFFAGTKLAMEAARIWGKLGGCVLILLFLVCIIVRDCERNRKQIH